METKKKVGRPKGVKDTVKTAINLEDRLNDIDKTLSRTIEILNKLTDRVLVLQNYYSLNEPKKLGLFDRICNYFCGEK